MDRLNTYKEIRKRKEGLIMKYVYMVKGFDIEFDLYTDALNFALNKYPGRAVSMIRIVRKGK